MEFASSVWSMSIRRVSHSHSVGRDSAPYAPTFSSATNAASFVAAIIDAAGEQPS